VRFLFNQSIEAVDLEGVNPNMTVLQWLRKNSHNGTKEGCASGDCGACTAVVGELVNVGEDKSIEYKSINTCIALVLSLSGKHLITVEGLAEGAKLHPVQQAMVQKNGSQCGFCTPGFVMSLFALYQNESRINLDKIDESLSGNLCRCTGYKPIISAAFLAFESKSKGRKDFYNQNKNKLVKSLQAIKEKETNTYCYKENNESYFYNSPTNIEQLATIFQRHSESKLIAGGSDLGLDITQQLKDFKRIINIQNVKEMRVIQSSNASIKLGASVSYHVAWEILVESFPALKSLLLRFASKPIRNWATIGGNIANASPIGDMPPVLIALNASLTLRNGSNVREVNLQDFFVSYRKTALTKGEFIESISIPKLSTNESLWVHKISKRYEDDISAVCMAIKITTKDNILQESRVAFGGMSEIPKRAEHLEKVIIDNWANKSLAQESYHALKKDFSPLDDVRATANYRLQVSAKLIEKTALNFASFKVPNMAETRHC
jgi:xanthine dehydrogenase small subunit